MAQRKASWNKSLTASVSALLGSGGREDEGPAPVYSKPKFTSLSMYKSIRRYETIGGVMGLKTPFFQTIEGCQGNYVLIDGRPRLNFAWCDYLGLNQHPSLREAAKIADDRFGTCVSGSRMAAGQTPLHLELEREIADFLGVDDALLFVSGHAANVSTIAAIMTPADLIVHDEFVHNSAVMGTRLSGATARPFKHNDLEALEKVLKEERGKHANCLVVIEGLYSAEGDLPDLAKVIELKERYGAWLMVDDAHGLGVLGKGGRGIAEHSGIDARKVDIWMGTLSKTLASCGGYIAGDKVLIEVLKHSAGGFVYSVGLPPAMTAAALAALKVIKAEPERVARLHAHGRLFLKIAGKKKFNTAGSAGFGMLPILPGATTKVVRLWHKLLERDINTSLIIYPGVPMKTGRLRFFLTSEHTDEEIASTLDAVDEEMRKIII